MFITLLLGGCATHEPDIEKLDIEKSVSSFVCYDGSTPTGPELLCPQPRADLISCPDGRLIGWPYECRSVDEIRLENGNTACAEQGLTYDPKTDACS